MRFFANVITKLGNGFLYHRTFDSTAVAVVPALQNLVAAGIEDGTFDVADARLTAEVIVSVSHGQLQVFEDSVNLADSDDLDRAGRQLGERRHAEGAFCDRLLGLP